MTNDLVQIAMKRRDIIIRARRVRELSHQDIRKVGAFVLENFEINILNTPVSIFLGKENGRIQNLRVYLNHKYRLTIPYKEELSAVQVLRDIYRQIRGYQSQ